MVIDDSKTIRRTAETLLRREGADVTTATDGFEALAKIADQRPQIIFVDIMMPRLDGYQTCALIKKSSKHKDTPVIMLSSKDSLFDRARGAMQATSAGGVANNIQHILKVTQQTQDGTQQTAQSVRKLQVLAQELKNSVSRFRISA